MQYKLREVVSSPKKKVYGITIPHDVAIFFKDVLFSIEKSGASIVLHSGCSLKPTKEEVESFDFETLKI